MLSMIGWASLHERHDYNMGLEQFKSKTTNKKHEKVDWKEQKAEMKMTMLPGTLVLRAWWRDRKSHPLLWKWAFRLTCSVDRSADVVVWGTAQLHTQVSLQFVSSLCTKTNVKASASRVSFFPSPHLFTTRLAGPLKSAHRPAVPERHRWQTVSFFSTDDAMSTAEERLRQRLADRDAASASTGTENGGTEPEVSGRWACVRRKLLSGTITSTICTRVAGQLVKMNGMTGWIWLAGSQLPRAVRLHTGWRRGWGCVGLSVGLLLASLGQACTKVGGSPETTQRLERKGKKMWVHVCPRLLFFFFFFFLLSNCRIYWKRVCAKKCKYSVEIFAIHPGLQGSMAKP